MLCRRCIQKEKLAYSTTDPATSAIPKDLHARTRKILRDEYADAETPRENEPKHVQGNAAAESRGAVPPPRMSTGYLLHRLHLHRSQAIFQGKTLALPGSIRRSPPGCHPLRLSVVVDLRPWFFLPALLRAGRLGAACH